MGVAEHGRPQANPRLDMPEHFTHPIGMLEYSQTEPYSKKRREKGADILDPEGLRG